MDSQLICWYFCCCLVNELIFLHNWLKHNTVTYCQRTCWSHQTWKEKKRSCSKKFDVFLIGLIQSTRTRGAVRSDAATAAEVEEAAAAFGAGVYALQHHEVHEAWPAAGGDEDLASAGLASYRWIRRRRRGEGRDAWGVGSIDAALVPIAIADSGAAVVRGLVAVRGGSRVLGDPRSCLPVDVVNFPCLPLEHGELRP